MNKKILISLSVIAAVAAIVVGGTITQFSNTEKADVTFAMGVVDIVVDEDNPWKESFSFTDVKPSQTKYIEFIVRNLVESNTADVWKHIEVTDQKDGIISQPECTEGGGTWIGENKTCTEAEIPTCCTGYTPRYNLAAYTIYDLWVCKDPGPDRCITDLVTHEPSFGPNWNPIIKEDQNVRLDNVSSAWIYLGQLGLNKALKVVQSYHVRSWPNASESKVGNWAQGDVMDFRIDLYAEQTGGLGPKGAQAIVTLENKDPETWVPINDDIIATLTYKTSGEKFDYSLSGKVKNATTEYCLIYYADPWPGDGTNHSTGALIGKASSDAGRNISIPSTQIELGTDLPNAKDQNYPGGAKVWLVPCTDYNQSTPGGQGKLTGWNPSEYLFDTINNLIQYDDTNL